MAVTRANLETVLIRRVGTWLTASGLDGTTIDGTNVDLSDPLAAALMLIGTIPADISNVTDSDLTSVATTDYNKLLDLAELRTLESALENYKKIDVKAGQVEAKNDNLGQRMERAIDRKRQVVAARYGIDGMSVQSGVIDLNFQTRNDTTILYTL